MVQIYLYVQMLQYIYNCMLVIIRILVYCMVQIYVQMLQYIRMRILVFWQYNNVTNHCTNLIIHVCPSMSSEV